LANAKNSNELWENGGRIRKCWVKKKGEVEKTPSPPGVGLSRINNNQLLWVGPRKPRCTCDLDTGKKNVWEIAERPTYDMDDENLLSGVGYFESLLRGRGGAKFSGDEHIERRGIFTSRCEREGIKKIKSNSGKQVGGEGDDRIN